MTVGQAAFQGGCLAREGVLSVATHRFIGCYGHVRRTNMERVSSEEVKLRSMPQDTLAWHCLFRASLLHTAHDFYDYDLMPLLKNFWSRH